MSKMRIRCITFLAALAIAAASAGSVLAVASQDAPPFPGPDPGPATARLDDKQIVLRNEAVVATWSIASDRVSLESLQDRLSGATILGRQAELFTIEPAGGHAVKSSQMRLSKKPSIRPLAPRSNAVRRALRCPGWIASAEFTSADTAFQVEWSAVLRDGSNYVRQRLTLRAARGMPKVQLTLLDLPVSAARTLGTVDGSPVVAGNWFFGCEHPMAVNNVDAGRVHCSVSTFEPLAAGQSCSRDCAMGVVPGGQLRRGFLYYLERERPRPYQPFLHYNSWYDIAWGDRKMDEPMCLEAIRQFGHELFEQRGVKLDSLVFDDGWDDSKTLWRFHGGFPRGFTPLQQAAAKYRSSVGVWLSPWGGYGPAKDDRIKYGREQGFEMNSRGFSLAGPKYYERFREVCAEMVRRYGVNSFKFDGIGADVAAPGAGEFAGDVEGLLRLTRDLRRLRPDVFINITTGTWPSPYWLWYGDSVWRSGGDMGVQGPGTLRQQWITYRDMITYQKVVLRGPLYPTSSLMTQGIVHAPLGLPAKFSPDLKDMADEIRSFFASGTQLQELYIRPQMMTPTMWDLLAEGALWSRRNADVLVDVHWIGGDPGKQAVYGFAAWSPRQSMLSLRNPSPKAASLAVDIAKALELPAGAPRGYRLSSPWKQPKLPPITLTAGQPHKFELAPFEVLVFDAVADGTKVDR